ncbi:nuclear transcription factor Y subunit gamma isoform X1 [Silurus meridionalis]|nr:nuclear transcription factor Y subunit gamma isoform X1 [Silurus meridionalis]
MQELFGFGPVNGDSRKVSHVRFACSSGGKMVIVSPAQKSCFTFKAQSLTACLHFLDSDVEQRANLRGVKWRDAPLLRYRLALRATCMEQAGASRRDPADSACADSIDFPRVRGAVDFANLEMSGDSFGSAATDAQQNLQSFWPRVMEEIRNLTVKDFRVQELPLARIKKIMKLDEDVKMISAEAPVLFAKAAQIFITELTLRAWIHTEDNKRRTLQRNDIAMAITKFDQFDFLIDIVPRDDLKPPKRQEEVRQSVASTEPVQYYFTLAQQPGAVQVQGQQQGQQVATPTTATTLQPGQIIIAQPQQGQVLQGTTMQQLQQVQVAQSQATPITSAPVTMQVGEGQQVQIVQAAAQGQAQAQAAQPAGQTMQVMQQIITNTGEIQQIPVQLNAGGLQYIRLAQPVSGAQVVQGQIQTLATNTQQVSQTEVQQGQQQFSQFTDGQQLYQIQQVTMPAGQELTQPMFIQSTSQTADGQVTTQVSAD